jgi:hypothetical protein
MPAYWPAAPAAPKARAELMRPNLPSRRHQRVQRSLLNLLSPPKAPKERRAPMVLTANGAHTAPGILQRKRSRAMRRPSLPLGRDDRRWGLAIDRRYYR